MAISKRERKLIEEARRILEEVLEDETETETKKDAENRVGSRHLLRRLRRMSGV